MKIVFSMWRHSTFPESFPRGPLGGAEVAAWQIARKLSQHHEVEIHCLSEYKKDQIQQIQANRTRGNIESGGSVRLVRIGTPMDSKWFKGDIYFNRSLQKAKDADIIQAVTCIEPALYHPRVFLHLENELHPYLPYPRPKRSIYEQAIPKLAGVFGVSRYVSKNFTKKVDFDGPVKTILNGADCSQFTPRAEDRELLMERTGIPTGARIILYVGAIHRRKGLHLLLQSFEEVSKEQESYLMVIGGIIYSKTRPEDLTYLKEQEKRMKRNPKVIFLGPIPRPELPLYLASSDIFICPSIWNDPCPLVCAEAQASGIPVIGFNKGGIPEIIEHNKTGLICRPDKNALIRNMGYLLGDPRQSRKMGKKARIRAQMALDWSIIAKKMELCYRKTE